MEPELIRKPKYVVETLRFALISGNRGARHMIPRPKRKKSACSPRFSSFSIGRFKTVRSLTQYVPGSSLGLKDLQVGTTTIGVLSLFVGHLQMSFEQM